MTMLIGVALGLSSFEWTAIAISGGGFIIMFGIASAKGDFQVFIKTTLENDAARRDRLKQETPSKNKAP